MNHFTVTGTAVRATRLGPGVPRLISAARSPHASSMTHRWLVHDSSQRLSRVAVVPSPSQVMKLGLMSHSPDLIIATQFARLMTETTPIPTPGNPGAVGRVGDAAAAAAAAGESQGCVQSLTITMTSKIGRASCHRDEYE